jgi:hypothetical protein
MMSRPKPQRIYKKIYKINFTKPPNRQKEWRIVIEKSQNLSHHSPSNHIWQSFNANDFCFSSAAHAKRSTWFMQPAPSPSKTAGSLANAPTTHARQEKAQPQTNPHQPQQTGAQKA